MSSLLNVLDDLQEQEPGGDDDDDDNDGSGDDDGSDDGGDGKGGGDDGGSGKGNSDDGDGEMSAVLPAKIKDVRRVLAPNTVVELLWQVSPQGTIDIWPALVTEVLKRVVRIRWLCPLNNGVLIINEAFAPDSWEMKHITDTCAAVTKKEGFSRDQQQTLQTTVH